MMIVGEIETGFLRSKSGSLIQFTAPGSTSTVANGINDFGQIVGQSSGTSGLSVSFGVAMERSIKIFCRQQ